MTPTSGLPDGNGTSPSDELALERVVATQEAAAAVLGDLMRSPPARLDDEIDAALARLGTHLGVDRTYVFQVRDAVCDNTHEWCAPGITPEIENLQAVPLDTIGAWVEPLRDGRPIVIDDVSALPDDRAEERALLADQDIQSLLVVPLTSGARWWGFVGFDAVRVSRSFRAVEVRLLRSVADVLAAVLVSRRAERRAQRIEARLLAITEHATELVCVVAPDGALSWVSPSWDRLGVAPQDSIGAPVGVLAAELSTATLARALEDAAADPGAVVPVPDLLAADGTTWLRGSARDLRHEPAVAGVVVSLHDITGQLEAEQRLEEAARRDSLTGLPNRDEVGARLERACLSASRRATAVSVLFVDLDGFKLVNDTRGHAVGDEVLREIAQRLAGCTRTNETVGRFGGDEFVIVVDGDEGHARQVADRALLAIAAPVRVGAEQYRLTASIGIRVWRGGEVDPSELVRDADVAMFSAKADGRNRVAWFDDELVSEMRRRSDLTGRLLTALDNRAVQVHFQSFVRLADRAHVAAEALARWSDEVLGDVSPAEFVPVAEEAGLISRLSEQVFERAIRTATTWAEGHRLSVNLSRAQLVGGRVFEQVTTLLDRHGLAPDRLVVEVTESLVMSDPDRASAILGALRKLGVMVALDDFGSGHSSLAMLRDLPLDIVKIDRAFVAGVEHDGPNRSLVSAIIGMCDELGLTTLSEGVEEESQHRVLLALGCEYGQGWLYGHPSPEYGGTEPVALPL